MPTRAWETEDVQDLGARDKGGQSLVGSTQASVTSDHQHLIKVSREAVGKAEAGNVEMEPGKSRQTLRLAHHKTRRT